MEKETGVEVWRSALQGYGYQARPLIGQILYYPQILGAIYANPKLGIHHLEEPSLRSCEKLRTRASYTVGHML